MRGAARTLQFLAALAGALIIAAVTLRPPSGPDAPDDFSTTRAMAHIRAIAKAPHPTGSPQIAEVRALLLAEMAALGLDTEVQPFPQTAASKARLARWGAPYAQGAEAANVIGILPGTDRTAAPIVLMAHYDTVWNSPGAADDSAGVAVALEVARVLKATGPRRRDLMLLFTDAEETSLGGARYFFAQSRPVGAVLNLEARGAGGRAAMFETGDGAGELMQLFADDVRSPTAHSVAMLIYELLPNDTDFTPARESGRAGFNFAFIGRPGLYHSPLATPDRVSEDSVRHLGRQALDLARALTAAPDIRSGGENPVFSDIFGLVMITYAPPTGWIPVGVAALGLLVAAVASGRQRDWRWRELAVGLVVGLVFVAVTGAALHGMNLVSGHGSGANYYDRLAATGWLELQALLLCIAVALVVPRRWTGFWGGWLALLVIGLAAATALQVWSPQAGPLVAWPIAAVAVFAAVMALYDPELERAASLPALVLIGALISGFVLYWAHMMFVGAGQDLPAAMAPFAFLSLAALWPLVQRLRQRRLVALTAMALLVASTGVALMVRFDPLSPMAATYG